MNTSITKAALVVLVLASSGAANADFGVGVKGGTLGLGIEGRWSPLPWLDVRAGANQYDFEVAGSQAGINYDATFAMDNYYLTGNIRFPLSPFRVTAGAFSNGNGVQMVSQDTGGALLIIGNTAFDTAEIGSLVTDTSFANVAPYIGFGYDFEVFGKIGLNLDFGLLWQGEPTVDIYATGYDTASPATQALLDSAYVVEKAEFEYEISNFKAWPVMSLSFVYNF